MADQTPAPSSTETVTLPLSQRIAALQESFQKADTLAQQAVRIAGSYDSSAVGENEFDAYDPGWRDFDQWVRNI